MTGFDALNVQVITVDRISDTAKGNPRWSVTTVGVNAVTRYTEPESQAGITNWYELLGRDVTIIVNAVTDEISEVRLLDQQPPRRGFRDGFGDPEPRHRKEE